MEMAGIEPASERLELRTSTSVSDFYFRFGSENLKPKPAASRLNPKVLFRVNHGFLRGTSALYRLSWYRLKSGSGRRGLQEAIASLFKLLTQLKAGLRS
jgi:hypothetical protein